MTNLTITEIHEIAKQAAIKAEAEFMQQYGEPAYCGFAWVKLMMDGRKPETKQLVKAGIANKSWDRGYVVWNPANNGTQSMDVKESGARAYAKVMQSFGINAYAQSRAD
jgi:hypothetical protein